MIQTLEDVQYLSESIELECKLAIGKNGAGGLPQKTFWETYSAFANTNGGSILLGVKETKGCFEIVGIDDVQKVLDEFWTSVKNPQTISECLVADKDVNMLTIDGKTVIKINIPRASRHQKPVYRGSNPMEGTYQRVHSSDILCSADIVKRMLAEQLDDSRDDKLLEGYDTNDIERETLKAYRQLYASRNPDNERNRYEDVEFLRSIGGWKRDRVSGVEGLSVAGLLMFGKLMSIQEVFPSYMLDYQERPEAKTEARWIDRVTLDGSWTGNLFDFYSRIIKKLTLELKIPFRLDGDKRVDSTPVHDAIREALVNTIVHADYSGKASVLVVKRPDMFGFRNPGLMRVSIEQAISGYEHDCRNEKLHQMFHFIGLGERAGSGIPNIFKWWNEKHWRPPYLHEKLEPYDQTLFELRMIDLIDDKIISELRSIFGESFDELDNTERFILATALGEQTVTHSRVKEICTEHNYDLSQTLHRLVQKGMLVSSGYGQGMVYHLPTAELISPEDVFGSHATIDSLALGVSSGGKGVSSGGYVVNGLEFPIYDKLENIEMSILEELRKIAQPTSLNSRLQKKEMEEIVIELCREKYLSFACLVGLLNRSEDYVRKNILNQMVGSQKLLRAFPKTPNDPRQAYTSTKKPIARV